MQHAVAGAQCEADMRGRKKPTSVARNYSDDVAAVEFRLNFGDLFFWNFIERPRGNIRFHPRQRTKQRTIRGEITVMPPAHTHLTRGMRDAAPAKIAREIFHQTPAIIV